MRSVRAMIAAAALAATAVPAAADWQYTTWGMTPDQVRAASGGAARDNADRALDADGVRAELTAPYQGVSLPFTAVFLFDGGDKLRYVTLHPVGGIACPVIVDALGGRYGAPGGRVDTGRAKTLRWDDADDDNLVVFSDRGGGDCTIQYSRLPPTAPDGKGL